MALDDLVPDNSIPEGTCPDCNKEGESTEIDGQYRCTTDPDECEVITWMV